MELWGWGAGNHGQLLSSFDDHAIPSKLEAPNSIELLLGGGSHTVIISDKKVLTVGGNDEGQLGVDYQKGENTDICQLQKALEYNYGRLIGVGCGWSHTLVLLDELVGKQSLYVFGSNSFGQLGISATQSSIPLALPLLNDIKIASVSCGMRHSAFTTSDGVLWLFGENRFGQCGVPTLAPVTLPTRLQTEEFVISVSLGSRHTMFLAKDGGLFTFGENRFGQCGADPSTVAPIARHGSSKPAKDIIPAPYKVTIPVNMDENTKIRCGWNFSLVFVDGPGQHLYLFGRNNYGQLGLGRITPFEWTPVELDTSFLQNERLLQVECGSEHCLLLTSTHKVFTFGWNDHGQLGHGDEIDRSSPTLVSALQNRSISRIAAGYGFSFALVDDL